MNYKAKARAKIARQITRQAATDAALFADSGAYAAACLAAARQPAGETPRQYFDRMNFMGKGTNQ